jgi:hypothetical protein
MIGIEMTSTQMPQIETAMPQMNPCSFICGIVVQIRGICVEVSLPAEEPARRSKVELQTAGQGEVVRRLSGESESSRVLEVELADVVLRHQA